MLKRLWDFIFGINWTVGLGDGPSRDCEDDWECGPQGAGYLPLQSEVPGCILPAPTRPAPPMPQCRPPKPDSIERDPE